MREGEIRNYWPKEYWRRLTEHMIDVELFTEGKV